MDIVTGLMMTAVALFEEAETPLGETAFLRSAPEQGGVLAMEIARKRNSVVRSIRDAYEMLEQEESGRAPEDKQAVYDAMRQLADWFARGRFQGEEE